MGYLDDEEEMEASVGSGRVNTPRNNDKDEVKSWDTEAGLGAAAGGGEWVEDMDTGGGAGDAVPGGFGDEGEQERERAAGRKEYRAKMQAKYKTRKSKQRR